MEFSLLAAAAIGVAAFWGMLRWEGSRGNASQCSVDLFDAGLVAGVVGVFVGRVVAMATVGISPFSDPGQILLVRSGVSTEAAAAAALATFAFLARKDLTAAADGVAAAALAGLAGWHAGCLPTNACLGTASDLPWAYALDGSAITRHPVELYAVLGLSAGAVAIAWWRASGPPPAWAPAGAGLAIASAVRLATEPMRLALGSGPVWFYAVGLITGLCVVLVASVARRRQVRTRS